MVKINKIQTVFKWVVNEKNMFFSNRGDKFKKV